MGNFMKKVNKIVTFGELIKLGVEVVVIDFKVYFK